MTIKTILNATAAASVKLTSRMIGYTVFGVFFNLVLFLYFANTTNKSNGGLPWLLLCLITLFAPFMYFLVGKKQGVAAAIHLLVDQHGKELICLVLDKLFDTSPQLLDSAHASGTALHEKLTDLVNRLSDKSIIHKLIINGLLQKSDFIAVVCRVLENNPAANSGSKEETVERIANALKEKININNVKPDMRSPAQLVAGNLVAAYVCANILPWIFR